MPEENGQQQKVTNALILHRMEQIERVLVRMENKIDTIAGEEHQLCIDLAKHSVRIDDLSHDVESLEKKSNLIDMLTGTGAVLAAILGALGLTRS